MIYSEINGLTRWPFQLVLGGENMAGEQGYFCLSNICFPGGDRKYKNSCFVKNYKRESKH